MPLLSRKLTVLLTAATLALGGGAVGLWRSTAQADHPMEAELISQRCATFSKATVWVAFRAGIEESSFRYLLHLHEDGRIALDSVYGGRERIYWDSQKLTISRSVNPAPRNVDGYDQIIADVWSECRAGFANSTWTEVPKPSGVGGRTRHWMSLDMPFAWAQQVQVLVGYMPGSAELDKVVLMDTEGNVIHNFGLRGENWTASFPAQALGLDVPPFLPPTWPGWEYHDAVSQEVLDGMHPDDLIISHKPIHRFDPNQ